MSPGRIASTVAAALAVAGCAVVAIGMASADSGAPAAHSTTRPYVSQTPRPAHPPIPVTPSSSTAESSTSLSRSARTHRPVAPPPPRTTTTSGPARPTLPPTPPTPSTHPATHPAKPRPHIAPAPPTHSAPPTTKPAPPTTKPAHHAAPRPGRRLPLAFHTHGATQVLTVVAHSRSSTTATLQGWTKVGDHRWRRHGGSATAHLGSDGLGGASEYRSATPIGSFTLTRAFGADSDPGTALPYLQTTSADWWISQSGPLYNTHQRCSSGCSFTQGSPNEHLRYETPYYNYAVVIDYNTRNAPGGVRPGKGSAFFLHVTDGAPTAGCVAIPQSKLVHLMQWMRPSGHPRILIGVN
jgi:L,D-peptidoglycan transpeptidase YkuD (ErfK/YbiS/YcfS/YnhG family)